MLTMQKYRYLSWTLLLSLLACSYFAGAHESQCTRSYKGAESTDFDKYEAPNYRAWSDQGPQWTVVPVGERGPLKTDYRPPRRPNFKGGYTYLQGIGDSKVNASINTELSVNVAKICTMFRYATISPADIALDLYVEEKRHVLYTLSANNTDGQWEWFGVSCCLPWPTENRKIGFTSSVGPNELVALDYIEMRVSDRVCDEGNRDQCFLVPPPPPPPKTTQAPTTRKVIGNKASTTIPREPKLKNTQPKAAELTTIIPRTTSSPEDVTKSKHHFLSRSISPKEATDSSNEMSTITINPSYTTESTTVLPTITISPTETMGSQTDVLTKLILPSEGTGVPATTSTPSYTTESTNVFSSTTINPTETTESTAQILTTTIVLTEAIESDIITTPTLTPTETIGPSTVNTSTTIIPTQVTGTFSTTASPTTTITPTQVSSLTTYSPTTTITPTQVSSSTTDSTTTTITPTQVSSSTTDSPTTTIAPTQLSSSTTDSLTTTIAPTQLSSSTTDSLTTTIAPTQVSSSTTDSPTTIIAPTQVSSSTTDSPTTTITPTQATYSATDRPTTTTTVEATKKTIWPSRSSTDIKPTTSSERKSVIPTTKTLQTEVSKSITVLPTTTTSQTEEYQPTTLQEGKTTPSVGNNEETSTPGLKEIVKTTVQVTTTEIYIKNVKSSNGILDGREFSVVFSAGLLMGFVLIVLVAGLIGFCSHRRESRDKKRHVYTVPKHRPVVNDLNRSSSSDSSWRDIDYVLTFPTVDTGDYLIAPPVEGNIGTLQGDGEQWQFYIGDNEQNDTDKNTSSTDYSHVEYSYPRNTQLSTFATIPRPSLRDPREKKRRPSVAFVNPLYAT